MYKFRMTYFIRGKHLFMCARIAWRVKLLLKEQSVYRVKKGQTLNDLQNAFCIPARLIAIENALTEELRGGEVLFIPEAKGNLYVVRGGESKTLLCGSEERFFEKNKTNCLYPAQKILL